MASRRNRRGAHGSAAKRDRVQDLWRRVPEPDDVEPITPVPEPTALIQSLGQPPLRNHSTSGEHAFAAVVERAAILATALAASAGMLAETPSDDEEG